MGKQYPDKNLLFTDLRTRPKMSMQEIVQVAWKYGLPPDDVKEILDLATWLRDRKEYLDENNRSRVEVNN